MSKSTRYLNYKRLLLLALAVLYICAPLHRGFLVGFHKITHLASHTSAAHEHEKGYLKTANDLNETKLNEIISRKVHGHEHIDNKTIALKEQTTLEENPRDKHHDHQTVSSEAKKNLKTNSEEKHHNQQTNTTSFLAGSKFLSETKVNHITQSKHQHLFVSFINELFSSEKNTSDHIATQLELDKHFVSEYYVSEELPRKYRTHIFFYNFLHYSAFQKVGLQPPKSNFS